LRGVFLRHFKKRDKTRQNATVSFLVVGTKRDKTRHTPKGCRVVSCTDFYNKKPYNPHRI
jgi:hypothetical protein